LVWDGYSPRGTVRLVPRSAALIWLWLTTLALLSWPRVAAAEAPRLDYEAAGTDCFDRAQLARDVQAIVGRDVLAAPAVPVRVSITRVGADYLAEIVVQPDAVRRLRAPGPTCRALESSLVVALAVALTELDNQHRAPRAVAATGVTPLTLSLGRPPSYRAPPPASAPRGVSDHQTYASAGLLVELGDPTGGLAVGLGTRREGVSAEAQLRLARTATLPAGDGTVRATVLAFGVTPCRHVGLARVCLELAGGAILARGEGLIAARSVVTPHATVGASLGWTWPVSSVIALRFDGVLRAATTETVLLVDEMPVWQSARLGIGAGVSVLGQIP
jgi:hypothetical protein